MFILSDLNGNLIQKSNVKIENLQTLINRFSSELGMEVIGTTDETLYLKTKETGYFDIIIEDKKIVDIMPKEKHIDLDEYKQNKIAQSKQQLHEFLESNPLEYNNELYSVTQEKQSLLTSAIAAYQLKIQAGIPAVLKWNTTGDICREFTLEEITGLVVAITEYVQPRVEKQQALEVAINNCTTIEELDNIEINYEVV
jgi:hypothetical protein